MVKLILVIVTNIIMFFSFEESIEKNNKCYTCDEITQGIVDESLYDKLSNGKLIFRTNPDLIKNGIYIIKSSENQYYVSKKLMRKIKKSINKNNCKGIFISKVENKEDINIIRD